MNLKRSEKRPMAGKNQSGMNCSWTVQSASSKQQAPEFRNIKNSNQKSSKLLSSRSLSQLVSRSLFFRKRKPSEGSSNKLTTTKSFPTTATSASADSIMPMESTQFINRIQSASLLGLPGQSSAGKSHEFSHSLMAQPNLSPIVGGGANDAGERVCDMSWSETTSSGIELAATSSSQQDQDNGKLRQEENNEAKKRVQKNSSKYKLFKNTGPVLRDVKNSLALRLKAKHESQAFARLTDELSSPARLYSPFDIYTDTSCSKIKPVMALGSSVGGKSTVKRKLNLNTKIDHKQKAADMDEQTTLKCRVALQHKRQLMVASKFTFDSPTNRLRETVKEVEHFQQCIENISKAISSRESSEMTATSPKVWKRYPTNSWET